MKSARLRYDEAHVVSEAIPLSEHVLDDLLPRDAEASGLASSLLQPPKVADEVRPAELAHPNVVRRVDREPVRDEEAIEAEEQLAGSISGDVKILREYLTRYYGGLPRELLAIGFYGFTLYLLSPYLTGLIFLAMLPALLIVGRLGRRVKKRAGKALENYSELVEWLQMRFY